jgi:hypothetical protein
MRVNTGHRHSLEPEDLGSSLSSLGVSEHFYSGCCIVVLCNLHNLRTDVVTRVTCRNAFNLSEKSFDKLQNSVTNVMLRARL